MEEVYIPGDLVKINGIINIIDGIFPKSFSNDRVIEAHAIEGDNTNRYRYDLDFGKIASIEPIPLIPVILEANGWEKLDNAFGFPSYNHTEAEWLNLCLEPDGWRAYCLDVVIKEFEFAHELQHLLFGLGLDSNLEV